MITSSNAGVPAWCLVLAVIAAPACGAGSIAAHADSGSSDATVGGSSAVSTECPVTACAAPKDCAPWAALCEQQYNGAPNPPSFCSACSGPNDSQQCDQQFCASAYPALADAGTVFGDCDTTTGRCRCFVISDDGGRSGYLDDGGVACARAASFDGGNRYPWNCQSPTPPQGTCSLPPFAPQVFTVTLWFEDDAAAQGGWLVTLGPDESATVGGHVYRNSGGGKVGAGPQATIEGDVLIDVDGKAGQLRFHHTGCATDYGQAWFYQAAVTRTNPFCPACGPATVGRQYSITSPSDGSTEYDFALQNQPTGCGLGVDLVGFVTHY
jgi:hypothetical protein